MQTGYNAVMENNNIDIERLEKTLISFNATTPPIQGITYRGKFEIEYIVTGTQLSKIAVFDFVVKAR